MSDGLKSSDICRKGGGEECSPELGSRGAARKEYGPRAGNLKDSKSSHGVLHAELGRNTLREDLKEGKGAFRNAGEDRNALKEGLKEGKGVFRNAAMVRVMATVSAKTVEALS